MKFDSKSISQDMDNLLRLSKRFKNENNVRFLFIGQGDKYSYLEKKIFSENISNILLVPSITQEEYKSVLKEIDVGLFSLAATHKSHNFPGKILGYMVESLPILGSVNPDNDLQSIVNEANAGNVFINGEDEKLLSEAKKLLEDSTYRIEQGKAAYNLLQKEFSTLNKESQN